MAVRATAHDPILMALPFNFEAESQKSDIEAERQRQLARLTSGETVAKQRYGTNPDGTLNWTENQVDPFSVTAQMTRLFRQERDQQQYGGFSGGYGNDGAAGFQAATLATGQQARQRQVLDEFNQQIQGFGRSREDVNAGAAQQTNAINAQLAQAFADDQAATLAAAPSAQAAAQQLALPQSQAPQANLVKRPSAAHGGAMWLYRVNANGGLTPVRPA
jgi:hypothetical protein